MNLQKKDKNGNSYLSYSQLSLFKRSKEEYFEQYIIGKPFEGNAYTDFGTKVGEALEKDNYSDFSINEKETLKKVTRLDLFERRTILNCKGFYIVGYIDSLTSDFTF